MATNWTIRIFKSWAVADLSRSWVNNYELVSAGDLSPLDMVPVLNTLVAAEKTIHYDKINFIQATISTWQPDSKPYNPLSFLTVPLSGQGSAATGALQLLDSNVCFLMRFQADLGRSGRRFYRGALSETDVDATPTGGFQFAGGLAAVDAGGGMSSFRTALAPLLPSGAGLAKLHLLGKGITFPSTARPVTSVHTGGIVINRRNHRYFDRATPAFG